MREIEHFVIAQFRRIPRWGLAILGPWVVLGLVVAYFPTLQDKVPLIALVLICAPAGLLVALVGAWAALRVIRKFLTPFIWLARKVRGHG